MPDAVLMGFMKEGFYLAAACAAPVLAACLLVGVAVSFLQALTQVQDQSVSYVPKLAAVGAILALAGPSVIRQLAEFARAAFSAIGGM